MFPFEASQTIGPVPPTIGTVDGGASGIDEGVVDGAVEGAVGDTAAICEGTCIDIGKGGGGGIAPL